MCSLIRQRPQPSLSCPETNRLLNQPITVLCLWAALRKAIEVSRPYVVPTKHDRAVTWSYLDVAMWTAARATGQAMTPEQAIAYAKEETG